MSDDIWALPEPDPQYVSAEWIKALHSVRAKPDPFPVDFDVETGEWRRPKADDDLTWFVVPVADGAEDFERSHPGCIRADLTVPQPEFADIWIGPRQWKEQR